MTERSMEALQAQFEQQQAEFTRVADVLASAPDNTIVDAESLERLQNAFAAISVGARQGLVNGVRV